MGREQVLGGAGGGVEIDHVLVPAAVEGIVGVEKPWEDDEQSDVNFQGTYRAYLPPDREGDPPWRRW